MLALLDLMSPPILLTARHSYRALSDGEFLGTNICCTDNVVAVV